MVRMVVLVVGALGVAGCIEPGLTPCGSNLCPAGTTCIANELCAGADQIAACDGLVDGASCMVRGGPGYCDRGVCIVGVCGNSVIDAGEVCDGDIGVDVAAGELCSIDCQRIEVCGNGIVDPNEECDDGFNVAVAGCDACRRMAWRATGVIGGAISATAVPIDLPNAIAVDRRGNVYVADESHRIRRIDATGIVTNVAGNGELGSNVRDGFATSAAIGTPGGVAVDGLGNVYFADSIAGRVYRVDTAGLITTVAGTGNTTGVVGDGGPATSARLLGPFGVAVDGLGNLYIAENSGSRIRRVDPLGTITTLAGTGLMGFSGDGGPATLAQVDRPTGIAVDVAGNVYIAEESSNRVRRVAKTGIITTVAGTGIAGYSGDGGPATSAQLYGPRGLAVDSAGNLYVADRDNNRIRRVDGTGTITTVAGTGTSGHAGDGGPASSAQLVWPSGVAFDPAGNLYIADRHNLRIRRVDTAGVITTFAGTGTANFDEGPVSGMSISALRAEVDGQGALYLADGGNCRVRRVDGSRLVTVVGTGVAGFAGDGGPATAAEIEEPDAIVFDDNGGMYLSDVLNARIRYVNSSGVITTVVGSGDWGFSGDGGPATSAALVLPFDLDLVPSTGDLVITDTGNHRIRRVDGSGVIVTVAGNGTVGYSGDGGLATAAQLNYPFGVSVDGAGNIYIADTFNHRVRRVDPAGIITTIAGTGTSGYSGDGSTATGAQLSFPNDVAVDALGNVYFVDTGNDRVRRVGTNGIITTVVGTGVEGYGGDFGPATSARIANPRGVTVDATGALYITERALKSDRVRRIDPSGVITTMAGAIDPDGVGPLARAQLADPRALVVAAPFSLFAGGSTGTLEVIRANVGALEVVAGRHPQDTAIGQSARLRDVAFGTVSGVAYDESAGLIYITESTANRLHAISIVDPADPSTWTIAPLANAAGTAGFADGAAQTARFRGPTGLYFDAAARQLYVADTGNQIVRVIDLSTGVASATVRTIAGVPATRGYFGDGGAATSALLFAPQAVTRCTNGDIFVADTGNHRVRRIAAGTGTISTVLGDGAATSLGDGLPAASFPVQAPLGLACDALGNLFVTSTTTVRLLPADAGRVVDGTGPVRTIYGAPPRDTLPASVTRCLTGVEIIDAATVHILDSCTGMLVELRLEAAP